MSGPRPTKERKTKLGQILTDLRIESGKTLKEVETESKVSATLISGYEMGKISPKMNTLSKVLDIYN